MRNKKTTITLIAAAMLFISIAASAAEPFFKIEDVFPFDASRPANHASTLTQLKNGDLLATWFGGTKEGMPDVAVWMSRKPADAAAWTKPEKLIDDPALAEGNSLLYTDTKGKVYLFFVKKYAEKWDAWDKTKLFLQTSDDNAQTWTEARLLREDMGWMIRNNVIELPDGRLLLPLYRDDAPIHSLIWISGDGFKTWEQRDVPVTQPPNLQPAVVSLGGEKLLMLARHNGINGKIWSARSDDLGKTWKDVKKSKLPNPDSGIDMISLKSGTLVLSYNHNAFYRFPLSVSISDDDGGATWLPKKDVETDKKEFSYPFLIQTADGRIHLLYTADDRKTIRHAEFDEAWLRK